VERRPQAARDRVAGGRLQGTRAAHTAAPLAPSSCRLAGRRTVKAWGTPLAFAHIPRTVAGWNPPPALV